MSQSPAEKAVDSPWIYRFLTIDDLTLALTEYSALLDGTLTRHYGDPDDRGDGKIDPDLAMDLARKRAEIDACMSILEVTYGRDWRLLDLYYRTGLSTEFGAWKTVARRQGIRNQKARCPSQVRCLLRGIGDEAEDNRLDLPGCKAMAELCCRTDKDEFDHQREVAIGRLMHIHNRRWDHIQRTKMRGTG